MSLSIYRWIAVLIAVAVYVAFGSQPGYAEGEAPAAEAPAAAPAEAAPAEAAPAAAPEVPPDVDAVLAELAKLGPEAITTRITAMREEAAKLQADAAAMREQAAAAEAKSAELRTRVTAIEQFGAAVTGAMAAPAAQPTPEAAATPAEPAAAAPAEAATN